MSGLLRTDLRFGTRWLGIGFLTLVLVLVGALSPNYGKPMDPRYIDKVFHAIVFMLLMLVFMGPLKTSRHLLLFALLVVCGGLIELVQIPVPGRSAEAADFVADIGGALAGWLLGRTLFSDWPLKLERRLGLQ